MLTPTSTLSSDSRLWIFQAERELTQAEEQYISEHTGQFLTKWTAHNNELKSGFEIR